MPENGLVWKADARRWKFTLDGSGSHSGLGTGSYAASASAIVPFTPDALLEGAFFTLSMSVDIDAGTGSVTYAGPGAPLGVTYGGACPLTVEVVLEADECYNIGGNWYQNGTLKLYVGGVLKITASVSGTVSGGLGPHYLMYGGEEVYASLSPPTASTTGLPGTMPDTYAYSSSADATLTIWCEWQEPGSGVWTGHPVTFHPSNPPAVPGSCTDPGYGSVSGSTTTAFVLSTHAENSVTRTEYDSGTVTLVCTHVYCDGVEQPGSPYCVSQPGGGVAWKRWKTVVESKSTSVAAGLIADRDKSVGRIAPGTKFLMFRTEMPETKYAGSSSCDDNGVSASTTTGGTVHPHQAQILQEVTDSLAAMEDTFSYRSYSERQASGGWSKTVTFDDNLAGLLYPSILPCTDPDAIQTQVDVLTGWVEPPDNESYSSGRSYTFPSYVGPSSDMAGYLGHALERPRYINSWCNPHWSFFLWFEPWKVDGSPEGVEEYWLQLRQQHIDNAGLPSPSRSRNHVVSDGLANDQGMRAFFNAFTGGLPWVGVNRWQTKSVTPLTDYTYGTGSASLWSVDDGTLSTDATGVTSTPAGSFAGNPKFEMLLSSWTVEPFLWPALADAGVFDWVTGNISAVSVSLKGRNGETVAWPCTRGVESAWPKGQPSKYCGSWVQDYGADGVVDQGADQDAGGDSATVYADPALCTAAQGLADYTAAKLVFTVTPIDPTMPVTVKWPRLKYTKSASRLLVNESAQDQVHVHPDGPGVRTGDLAWYDGFLGWINPPLVEPGTSKTTAVDGLEYDRLLLRGVAYNGGSPDLTTELTQRWTSFEVNSVGGVARNSVSFFFPNSGSVDWRMALVNTISEVPPLGTMPVRKRDTSTWQPTGAWAQETWIWAQDYTRHVSTLVPGHVFEPLGGQWTASGAGVTGWLVTEHHHVLDNSESGFNIKQLAHVRGKDFRPWRGSFEVWAPDQARAIWNAVSRPGLYHEAWQQDGAIWHAASYHGRPPNDESNELDAADEARFATYDHGMSRIHYVFAVDGDVKYAQSTDHGRTLWTMSTVITGAKHPHISISRTSGYEIVSAFRLDTGTQGTIVAVSRHLGESAWSTEFTFKDSAGSDIAFEDDVFCLTHTETGQHSLVLVARKAGEDDISRWESLDGGKSWFAI